MTICTSTYNKIIIILIVVRSEGLDIFNDTTQANCYANSQCLGSSPTVTTIGSCCDNSVDPIGFSYQTASRGCQACPTGQII